MDSKRHTIIHVCLSGIAFMLSLQLVKKAHIAEDADMELREQIKREVRARKALLRSAPALAGEAGLSKASQEKFRTALNALAADYEANPGSVPLSGGAGVMGNAGAASGSNGSVGSKDDSGSKKATAVW